MSSRDVNAERLLQPWLVSNRLRPLGPTSHHPSSADEATATLDDHIFGEYSALVDHGAQRES